MGDQATATEGLTERTPFGVRADDGIPLREALEGRLRRGGNPSTEGPTRFRGIGSLAEALRAGAESR